MSDDLDRPSVPESSGLEALRGPAPVPTDGQHADLYDVPPTPERRGPADVTAADQASPASTGSASTQSAGTPARERGDPAKPEHPDGFPDLDRHRPGAGEIAKRWLGILAFVAVTLAGAIWAVHRVVTQHQADAKHARDAANDRPAGGRSFDTAVPVSSTVAQETSGASGTVSLSVVGQSALTTSPDHRPGPSASAPSHPVMSWYDADLIVGSGDAPAGSGETGGSSGSTSGSERRSPLAAVAAGAPSSALTAALSPTQIHAVQAGLTGNRDLRLSAGAKIPCAGDTAFDSTLAGISTCTVTSDVYSDNGHVLLIERGSTVNTEFRSAPAQGQRRVFILSARIQTPGGVRVQIDSPAADALGRMGIDGEVNNHWGERLGAAFLLSLVQDSIGYLASRSDSSNGTVVFENTQQTGNDMADRVLNSTINIPPTITKNQGADFLIVLARDIDFSSVYQLEAK
ncbi:type IV secretion system protein VirB10 [Burkholderia sp. WAC0059]|uniref:type IV secretion system protein VirB10 n=1 Tax=Burkholderia sp. WAC0059 TaxID=2066022 RepID=UPI000C7ECD04|nr:type IV secretion system protein VirB10 [Burkholderia sp. WAC0059]PLZ00421.1 type IV secretion system protein VirB10 [Burkholderia sp. WAC0059]